MFSTESSSTLEGHVCIDSQMPPKQAHPSTASLTALVGSIIHAKQFGSLELINDGALIYSNDGVIQQVVDFTVLSKEEALLGVDNIIDYTGKFIIPGFVDAHCHAPQYVFSGTGMDLPLLEWLQTYTFPCEARFADLEFARIAYEKSVRRHLKYGTTFASYFATIHNSAAKVLVDVVATLGQRAHVGKVSMDRNSPPFYVEETEFGCNEAEDFARHVLSMTKVGRAFVRKVDDREANASDLTQDDTLLNKTYAPLVIPCITPRFVPTCSERMMQRLGDISRKYGLPVQSHLSESPGEISWVASLHPECPTYADVYRKYGLLHNGTYMAHCCHSSFEERMLLRATGTGVVHCASSNFMLSSGVMDVRRFVEEGIKVAIGTDVAGGYSPSMLDAIRQSFVASKCRDINHQAEKVRLEKEAEQRFARRRSLSYISYDDALENVSMYSSGTSSAREMTKGITKTVSFNDKYAIADNHSSPAGGISPAAIGGRLSPTKTIRRINSEVSILTDNDEAFDETNGLPLSVDNLEINDRKQGHLRDDDAASESAVSLPTDADDMSTTSSKIAAKYNSLTYKEVFYLATQGGADVLGMGDVVGNFLPGKKLDALVIDVMRSDGPIDTFGREDLLEKFQKFLFLGDDRNIIHVYVDGRRVIG